MGLLDGYADSIERNALSAARRGMAEPAPEPSFSAAATGAAIGKYAVAGALEGFGAIRDFSNAIDKRHADEVKAREKRLGLAPTEPYIIPGGGAARKKADEFMADPLTAHWSQQVVGGFAKSLTKAGAAMALAGPTGGAVLFGLAEADDVAQRLQDKGIDSGTAWQVGGVVGALGAVGVRLPISGAAMAATAGGKVAATAALGVAGGPVSYMAQEGMAREILQRAGHADEAKLHDPLNPIGLAASMFPLAIGAVAVRSAIKRMPATTAADVVMAMESGGKRYGKDGALLTSPKGAQGEMQVMPGTATDPGFGVAPARDAGPDELARVGRDYLAAMEARYGNTDQAMAAYNAGPGAVDAAIKKGGADWLKKLPTETQNYVAKGRKALDDNATEQVRANPEAVDAARVTVLDQTVARSLPDHPMAHSEMLRAADMVGAGERVDVPDMLPRGGAGDAPGAGAADEAPANHMVGSLSTQEIQVNAITLSKDVPQFKSDANASGVVEPLGGSFDRTGVAPIQLWERTDGRLEVISGRHRLDLARRTGEKTIPAQVHREADGFDARRASALDAELNIRDGQGKVRDYVDYFHATGIGRATAEQRGLLARAIGKRAFTIANDGSPDLIAAHRAGTITDEAAVAIAGAAPGDGSLQAVGIRAVLDGKTIGQAANTVRAVKLLAGDRADTTGDMFGFDDSAMREAEAMAKIATSAQRDLSARISAISGAAKRPELAAAEGINVKDSAAVLRRAEQLRAERSAWDNWSTNPDLVAKIRAELHPGEDLPPLLMTHSAADLEVKAAREANAEALDQRSQIDAEREHFQLQSQVEDSRVDTTGDIFSGVGQRQASAEQQAVQALAEQHPDMPVRLPGDEKSTTLATALERIKEEQAHAAQEADLYRVAVQCALTAGAATA